MCLCVCVCVCESVSVCASVSVCVCRLSDSEVLLDYSWASGRGDVFRVWR